MVVDGYEFEVRENVEILVEAETKDEERLFVQIQM